MSFDQRKDQVLSRTTTRPSSYLATRSPFVALTSPKLRYDDTSPLTILYRKFLSLLNSESTKLDLSVFLVTSLKAGSFSGSLSYQLSLCSEL